MLYCYRNTVFKLSYLQFESIGINILLLFVVNLTVDFAVCHMLSILPHYNVRQILVVLGLSFLQFSCVYMWPILFHCLTLIVWVSLCSLISRKYTTLHTFTFMNHFLTPILMYLEHRHFFHNHNCWLRLWILDLISHDEFSVLIYLGTYLKFSTCSGMFSAWKLILRILYDFWHIISLVFCQLVLKLYFCKHLTIYFSALSKSWSLLAKSGISPVNFKSDIGSSSIFMPIFISMKFFSNFLHRT